MQTKERQIAINNLDQKRCINALRRIRRKGLSTSRVWCVSMLLGGVITKTLVMPESYLRALTPMMQNDAVIYNGNLR